AGAGTGGGDLLLRDVPRPDTGGCGGRARVRPLHGGAAVHGDRRRAAGLGLVVRGETPTADDGGQPTEGEERETLRRDTHKSGSLSAVCSKKRPDRRHPRSPSRTRRRRSAVSPADPSL